MDNLWVASYTVPFAIWRVIIPYDIEENLRFIQSYEQIAHNTEIAQITFEKSQSFVEVMGFSYTEYLAKCMKDEKILPFMIPSSRAKRGYFTSKISYYGESGVIQTDTSDLGHILKRIKSDVPKKQQYKYMQSVPPVAIKGRVFDFNEHSPEFLTFSIWLYSDIWFPYIRNWMGTNKWVDNNHLAQFHTPRLNQFIAGIRDLAHSYSGKVILDNSDTLYYYQKILSNEGIDLNASSPT